MTTHSPSQLAAQALKLPIPALPLSERDCHCGLCGQAIHKGTSPATHFTPALDFASEHLHPLRADTICQWCSAVLGFPGILTKYSRAVFLETGAHRLTTAQDIGWLLKHAHAPLVAVFNTRKSAHTVWQTAVTYDTRAIAITWAKTTGLIRTERVAQAYDALARLSKFYNTQTQSRITWPVEGLTLRDEHTHMCSLLPSHEHALRQVEIRSIQHDLESFDVLNQCERWALSAILLTAPSINTPWSELHFNTPPTISN